MLELPAAGHTDLPFSRSNLDTDWGNQVLGDGGGQLGLKSSAAGSLGAGTFGQDELSAGAGTLGREELSVGSSLSASSLSPGSSIGTLIVCLISAA